MTPTNTPATTIEPDPHVPIIRTVREFDSTAAQLLRAHTDPDLFRRWVGPDASMITIDHWECRAGGSWRFLDREQAFRGCFHDVRPDRIVQTFTWEGMPDQVALETLNFVDLGKGRSRLVAESLTSNFEDRDAWMRSGMATGIEEGYLKLDRLLADGTD